MTNFISARDCIIQHYKENVEIPLNLETYYRNITIQQQIGQPLAVFTIDYPPGRRQPFHGDATLRIRNSGTVTFLILVPITEEYSDDVQLYTIAQTFVDAFDGVRLGTTGGKVRFFTCEAPTQATLTSRGSNFQAQVSVDFFFDEIKSV